MKKTRIFLPVVAAAGFALLASACAGGSGTADAGELTAEQIAAGCSAYGDITLTVGSSEAGEAIADGLESLAAQFEEQNPNVTVDLQFKDWASSIETIKLVMSGDNPPDVMQGNSGWAINGALWQAGLLANLDPFAEHYGWFDEFPDSALTVNRFTPDGQTLGEGNLVGLPQALQYVGVFYNTEILAQLGIDDPTTLDDRDALIDALDAAKAAGITPVMLGALDGWPPLHNLSLFNGWYVPADEINAWVFNREGSTYDNEGRLQGSTDFQNWMAEGYYNADALATGFNDATARFGQGESAFFITGTWALGDVKASLGDKAGFMLFPAGDLGVHQAVGGYSLPYTISAKSKYPACAAQFIDFIAASPEAIDAQIAAGRPSATKAGADAEITDALLAQMVAEYERLNSENGLFTWEDWPTPTMGSFQMSEAQLLLGGQITPAEYNAGVQANWEEFMATR